MNSRKFFWTNIFFSSNILFYIGLIIFFLGNVAYILGINIYLFKFINWYLIIGSYLFYILIKIIWMPFLSAQKFKKTFSFKFLRKFTLNKAFRKRILLNVIMADFLLNFIPMGFIFGLMNVVESSENLYWQSYLMVMILIYILAGTGILMSYLSLIIWFKLKKL